MSVSTWKMRYPESVLCAAHEKSFRNEPSVKASRKCGCFYCQRVFDAGEISEEDWCDEDLPEKTAVCPYCGIDSVIGDATGFPLTRDFLHAMYEYWFC